jgi:hypothetical protein
MHRPVGTLFAIFARAIDRIDDPDAGLRQTLRRVLALFGEQAVVGRCSRRAWIRNWFAVWSPALPSAFEAISPESRTASNMRPA